MISEKAHAASRIFYGWYVMAAGFLLLFFQSGACLGQFIVVPIFNRLVLIYSWRISYLLIGLIILAVITILVFTVFKGDPEDLGIQPYGQAAAENQTDPAGFDNTAHRHSDLNLKQAMKTYSFWLFLISMFICGGGDFLIIIHLVTFGLRLLLFLMILIYRHPISFYIFAGGFGFTFLITAPLIATLSGRLYGFGHLGLISGFVTTIHHLGGGFWTYMGGLLFDATGSYQIIFVISAVLAVIAMICTMAIKEKRHQIK
jgi:nitrate/nitrite transporter NarK